jgi:hypothetical protein
VSIYYSSRLPLAAPGPEFPGIVFGQRVVRLVLGPGGEDGLVLLVDRKELGGVGGLYAPYYYDNDDFYFDNDYYDRYFDEDDFFFDPFFFSPFVFVEEIDVDCDEIDDDFDGWVDEGAVCEVEFEFE